MGRVVGLVGVLVLVVAGLAAGWFFLQLRGEQPAQEVVPAPPMERAEPESIEMSDVPEGLVVVNEYTETLPGGAEQRVVKLAVRDSVARQGITIYRSRSSPLVANHGYNVAESEVRGNRALVYTNKPDPGEGLKILQWNESDGTGYRVIGRSVPDTTLLFEVAARLE